MAWREQLDKDSSEEDTSTSEDEVVANFGVACRECQEAFPSNNQLHGHLKAFNAHAVEEIPTVIDLTAKPKGKQLEGIANCTETCVKAYLSANSDTTQVITAVVDSGFGRSAVNRKLLDSVPHTIKPIKHLVIRGIRGRKKVSELAKFVLYLRSNKGVFLKLEIKALIFDDLGTSLLIGTDYIKAWNLDRKPIAVIRLQITRELMANFVICAGKDCTIPANSVGQVALRMSHSGKADFLFTSQHPEIPNGVVSATQNAVMFSNQDSEPRQIKRGTILSTAESIRNRNFAYAAQATKILNSFLDQEPQNRAGSLKTSPQKAEDTSVGWLEEAYQPRYQHELPEGIVVPDPSTSTHREVRVNDKLPLDQQKQLRKLAKRFAVIFNDGPSMARQPEEEWLRIKVASELERNLKPRPPYRNAPRAKQAIDDTFNENIQLGRMAPAKHSPYSLPVFVVYKYTPEGAVKKARPVVDLRPLNDVAESDAYPLPLQEDILAAMALATYISSIDFVSSFYQHFTHPDD
ncbi:hypothetical protein EPUS_05332 [Endocarpon pusillum Z07020]|uniref:C2H2-type domain-containing protein n=1 Tax=Endocarpon pusillum (strain Z07020 / HMAS-L-300199) TaxID=1263415 RepID=U1HLX3_ENDPU|nr:uncharacterized protein EPUS_05332 [Endocarpon pusillum Z07020]ERF71280.1 hypothetical protein EPUS_05332 [Endocarpon pusillum Z07020]